VPAETSSGVPGRHSRPYCPLCVSYLERVTLGVALTPEAMRKHPNGH
jgi:hypothetical protein